uniref:Capsid protein n=2 Tax=Mamastrovirus TaxID=249588 RepID=A0A0C6DW95_PASV1|nr:capsid protein [Mamastrovirus 3]
MRPNANNKQNWVNKPQDAPSGHYNVKIAKDVDHYLTMQGFTSIASVDWYTIDFQPSEAPAPIQGLQVLVNSSKKADVYAVKQFVTAQTNNKHQVTTTSVTFIEVMELVLLLENLKVRSDTTAQDVNFPVGGCLMTNTAIFNAPAPPGWIWQNVELLNDTAYLIDQGMMHLIMPPPANTQLLFEMRTSVTGSRSMIPNDENDTHGPGEEWCDALDASESQVLLEETDYEDEEDEDEDDEADRFDLHSSYGSEPEDDDENNRVTLLSTLINQGMTVERATRITKRAFPTSADKTKRSVYMDLLASGLSPSNAWSQACEEARIMGTNHMPNVSGDRDHAE